MFLSFQTESPTHQRRSDSRIVLLSAFALLAAGCGGAESLARAPVSGMVYARGKPLTSGIVRFVPAGQTGGSVVVAEVDDGFFSLGAERGPAPGKYRVEIWATDVLGFDPGNQEVAERAMRTGQTPPRSPVPPRYRRNSPLVVEISPNGNLTLNFVLQHG